MIKRERTLFEFATAFVAFCVFIYAGICFSTWSISWEWDVIRLIMMMSAWLSWRFIDRKGK